MWVHDLRNADDEHCGGKARGLAKLIAAGLPVPDGFVIDDRAFRAIAGELGGELDATGHVLEDAARRIANAELPRDFVAEVEARAARLGARLAVRSSATIEDGAAGAAAGVFSSRTAVPLADLWTAIRSVWTSALTPLAAAYARGRRFSIAVIVQAYVEGELVTVYTRPPGEPGRREMLIQRRGQLARGDHELARAAEAAIGATDGADVELVGDAIVQARPIVHPKPRALVPPPPALLASLHDGRTWTWDVTHNPDPLSPAQQALVARVAAVAPYALRVVAGFLYASGHAPEVDVRDVARRAADLEARCERALDETHPPASLDDAIARYVAFYAIWANELSPLVSAARATTTRSGNRPSSIEAILGCAARGELRQEDAIATLGALSPAWDVAVPTYGERPAVLRDAIARARFAKLPPQRGPIDLAADLAERDDQLFARAQLLVRKALLARGRELGLAADDVFWLPLDELASPLDRDDAHRRAGAARAAAARAATWQMPVVVGGRAPAERVALRGVGTGPRVTGRVVRFASLASAIAVGAGDIVVTRAVTPALAVLVVGCAALVSETGHLLDHGAALARELGIPCVVDCHDAWSQLADGMMVTVDGDGGEVSKT